MIFSLMLGDHDAHDKAENGPDEAQIHAAGVEEVTIRGSGSDAADHGPEQRE
jgi:hypothetical protein